MDIFSELKSIPLGERIRKTKYTRWAQDLTAEQLEALLWAVGEFAYRAEVPLAVLRKHGPGDNIGFARAILGLEVLNDFGKRRPITVEQMRRKIWEVQAEVLDWPPPQGSREPGVNRPPKAL